MQNLFSGMRCPLIKSHYRDARDSVTHLQFPSVVLLHEDVGSRHPFETTNMKCNNRCDDRVIWTPTPPHSHNLPSSPSLFVIPGNMGKKAPQKTGESSSSNKSCLRQGHFWGSKIPLNIMVLNPQNWSRLIPYY